LQKNELKQSTKLRQKVPMTEGLGSTMMSDITWPLFKFSRQGHKKFWEYDTDKNCNMPAIFEGSLVRIGKKHNEPKAYLYRVTNNGILKYYKNVMPTTHISPL
jgi:hypothetical protein